MAASANLHLQDDDATTDDSDSDSDSDSEPDSPVHDAYYRPITADEDSDDSDTGGDLEPHPPRPCNCSGDDLFHHRNPNPNSLHLHAENDLSALQLNGSGGGGRVIEEEEEDVRSEREASVSRAFMEDENRRSAPLAPEAATRIMDAMRRVSFQGLPPDWIDQVPEDRWVDQLRQLRGV